MTDIRLFGYSDPLAAKAGEPIDFMVSAEGASEVKVELVRLVHGDFNPEGPGFIEEVVTTDIPASLPAKRQYTQIGSFARVSDPEAKLAPSGAFTVHAFIWPSLPGGARQTIMGRWSVSGSAGYALGINPEGKLEFWVGDGQTVDQITADAPLVPKVWVLVAASFDPATGEARLRQIDVQNSWNSHIGPVTPYDHNSHTVQTLRCTPAAADAIQGADCLIAFGASLNYHTTADGAFVRDRRVIQIADRMQDLGVCAEPDLGILGHPASVADTFVHWLDEAEIPGSGFTAQLPAKGLDTPEVIPAPGAAEDTVEFLPTMAALNDMLPEDRTIVTDVGRWMVRGYQMMTAPGPLDHVTSASFAAIGLGLATAIGAAAMRPDRPTVLVCGDGGFMLGNLTEFHSAVRAESDLIVIVFNDSSYGAEHIQFRNKQRDPSISLFNWPDFASVARSLGGDGMTLHRASDLDTLRQALDTRDRKRPYLIDVRIDPDHVASW